MNGDAVLVNVLLPSPSPVSPARLKIPESLRTAESAGAD